MSSETSPQLLRISSSQISRAHGSTPMCLVPPESTAGTFFVGTPSHFHGDDIPGINPRFHLFVAQLLFNCPKEISVLFPSWKSTKTSRVFHREAPIIQHPQLARPPRLFPLSGVFRCRSEISWQTVCKRRP